jgi:hypothetical protein
MDQAAIDHILTIVQLLAKGADDHRLSPTQRSVLYKNIEALIDHDSEEFVREFLARVRDATGVLSPDCGPEASGISIKRRRLRARKARE